MNLEKLKAAVKGQVLTDAESCREVRSDFGNIIERVPRAVVLPDSAQDICRVVRLANREGWSVSTRGAAHSQSGQALNEGGVLLDMSALNRIHEVQEESVWVQAGTLWTDLVKQTASRGLIPPVLTNNLNVTVGGTLSTAGLGVASHRYGSQADNVDALEVVTGEGHLVTCSARENRELFDCSRAGLGQFSIITRARLRLRRFAPRVRTYYLLYDDLESLLRDQERIFREARAHYVESWSTPCVQGFRQMGELRLPFAEWFFPVHLSVEYDEDPPSDESVLSALSYYRRVHTEDTDLLEFAHRLEPVFALWKLTGTWTFPHPWMEVVLPWDKTIPFIRGVLKDFPPNLLIGGHVLMWPSRGTTSSAPLFKHPAGEFVMGFGILPAVNRQFLPLVLPLLKRASDLSMQIGGKRYLSGWIDFDHRQWRAHFGESWPRLLEWKRFYDPRGVLNPGFIQYQPKSAA